MPNAIAFLAAVSNAAPEGRSSLAGRVIIVVCLVVAVLAAARGAAGRFKCGRKQ